MDEAIKELVKRLRDQKFQYSGPQPDVILWLVQQHFGPRF